MAFQDSLTERISRELGHMKTSHVTRKEEGSQVNLRFWRSGFELFPLPDSFCGHSFVT